MNRKEFYNELLPTFLKSVYDGGGTESTKYLVENTDAEKVWHWIEQYGAEQRIVGKENALFSLLELPSVIDVPHIVYIIENRIKELKDE